MEIMQLRYFVSVCEERSITRAAQRHSIVQSALSAQIAKLEREAGVRLLDRTNRGVTVTSAGAQLLGRARRILAEVDDTKAELSELKGVLTGVLRLGVINVVGQSAPCVDAALARFHRQHPAVEISIHDPGSSGIIRALRANELDLALIGLRRADVPSDLEHHVIVEHEVVAVVHRGHPLADAETATLVDLARHGRSVELRSVSGLRHYMDEAFAARGLVRQIAFDVATTDEAIRYASLGMGFALVPCPTVAPEQLRNEVAVLPVTDADLSHPIALVHRRPGPGSPAARALVREIRQSCG